MSATKHTPGPWKLILHGNEKYPYPLSVHTEDGSCWVARDGTVSSLDDARLIAAAPDMLEALRRIEALGSDGEHSGDRHAACRDIARAALAKAEASDV